MSLVKTVDFKALGDGRGSLIAIEENRTIPFPIKRVYYIYGTEFGVARGFHAHRALKQVAVCIAGSCRILLDNGSFKEDVVMNSPAKGMLIEPMIWHEMRDFSNDCVLLILASDHYDESDYIRNYEEFLKQVSQ